MWHGPSSATGHIAGGHWNTRQNPTATYEENLHIAEREFEAFESGMEQFLRDLAAFETELERIGAPYTKGRN